MLSALEHGKLSRSVLKEDTLTASVFDLLLCLPTALMWEILQKACSRSQEMPEASGRLEAANFWPRWDLREEIAGKYVEPDLSLRFENFDVIVEAKRTDENQQYGKQWVKELHGYFNSGREDDVEDREVFMLAVGGIWGEETEKIELTAEFFPKTEGGYSVADSDKWQKDVKVYKIKWQQILTEVTQLQKKLTSSLGVLDGAALLHNVFRKADQSFCLAWFYGG